MEHLLGKAAPPVILASVALESFVKKRIERFSSSNGCGTEIRMWWMFGTIWL